MKSSGRSVSARPEIGGIRRAPLRRSPRLRAAGTPTDSGSSRYGLRSSPRRPLSDLTNPSVGLSPDALRRLRAKGVEHVPQHGKTTKAVISLRKSPAKGKSAIATPTITTPERPAEDHKKTICPDSPDIETIMREDREYEAEHFKDMYMYKDDCFEERTCIHRGGDFNWNCPSSGITWVAFQGTSCTCVAFIKNLAQVKDRLGSYLPYNSAAITYDLFGTTVISEIEVLADLPSQLHQKFPPECKVQVEEPFAIVSVDPNTTTAEGDSVNKDAAVEYFKGIIKEKRQYFPPLECEKAVVQGLQILFKKQFKPEEIWVHEAFYGEMGGFPTITIKHLLSEVNDC